ncbi:MAG TPA: DUF885 domain-containing protein [Bryobacteraceae bacterium]|jgi:uncharacterized protein (DUF885 family)|nr:DUF885 domain-containing protein [Bryobacteraceae bacterium]
MRFVNYLLTVSVLLPLAACQRSSQEGKIRDFATSFIYESLALSPTTATAQGYHEDRGAKLDELWDDYSPAGIQRSREFYQNAVREADRLSAKEMTPELAADLEIIKWTADSQLLDLERIQPYRHNPTVYVEAIGNGLFNPLILNYAPEATRLAQITARMEKIPAFLETARQNLVDAPEVWNKVAVEENEGNLDLIDHTIRAKVPADLKARYDGAATAALTALKSFDHYLQTGLSQHVSDWRLGPQLYAEKFKFTLATGDSPQQTLADAEARLESIRDEMHKQAIALYPKFFPGKTAPQDLNSVVSQVLDKIAQQHATPEQYFDSAKRDLAETTQFVKDRHLLALPGGIQLSVIPTPEFVRGVYGVGGFSPAPALEPKLGSFYWITPFTADMTHERIESKLREYNFYGLKILTIHEAMPGHSVQFAYADEIEPKWRRVLRAVDANGPYVEGWAVYATELMIAEGYQDTPEMRLTFNKQMLRVVANTILDVKMQTMGMTDQQALDLMIHDTFQEKEEAEAKLQRAKLSSCQLPTYFVGWHGWDRLRDAYQKKEGSDFRLSEFHERALQEGAVPLPVLSDILLGNSRKTAAVSSAPSEGLPSALAAWRRASTPFALLR